MGIKLRILEISALQSLNAVFAVLLSDMKDCGLVEKIYIIHLIIIMKRATKLHLFCFSLRCAKNMKSSQSDFKLLGKSRCILKTFFEEFDSIENCMKFN